MMKTTAALLLAPCAALRAADEKPAKPNVIFIFADDQRADTIAALGNPIKVASPKPADWTPPVKNEPMPRATGEKPAAQRRRFNFNAAQFHPGPLRCSR